MPRKQEEKVAFHFAALATPVPQDRLAVPPNGWFFISGYCDGGRLLDERRRQTVALRLQANPVKEFQIIGNDDLNALPADQPVFLTHCLIVLAKDGTGQRFPVFGATKEPAVVVCNNIGVMNIQTPAAHMIFTISAPF